MPGNAKPNLTYPEVGCFKCGYDREIMPEVAVFSHTSARIIGYRCPRCRHLHLIDAVRAQKRETVQVANHA